MRGILKNVVEVRGDLANMNISLQPYIYCVRDHGLHFVAIMETGKSDFHVHVHDHCCRYETTPRFVGYRSLLLRHNVNGQAYSVSRELRWPSHIIATFEGDIKDHALASIGFLRCKT